MVTEKFCVKHGTAVAIGCFDGLHVGHKAVIDSAVTFGRANSLKSVVFKIERNFDTLLTCDETAEILCLWGIDKIVSQALDTEFMNLSCEEFVEQYLRNFLCAKFVSVGYNFRFGKGAVGDVAVLRKLCNMYDIEVCVIPAVSIDGEVVSTTKIREMLKFGKDITKYLSR